MKSEAQTIKTVPLAPFENSSLLETLDDGRIELWVSNDKKINYDSLYATMIEVNKKIARA